MVGGVMKLSKALLVTTFAVSVVVANLTAAKLTQFDVLWGLTVPSGFVALGVAFLCSDLLSELYGKEVARTTVNATIGSLVVGWMLVYVALLLPTAPFYDATAFNKTMSASVTIVLAGVLSMMVSQNLDVSVFHWVREYTGHHFRFLRNVGSTVVSQFVDTVLFIGLGFVVLPMVMGGSVTPLNAALQLVIGQYLVKIVLALLDTPLFYVGTMVRERTVGAV